MSFSNIAEDIQTEVVMQNFDQAVGNKLASEGKTVVSGFVRQLTQNKNNTKELEKWASLDAE